MNRGIADTFVLLAGRYAWASPSALAETSLERIDLYADAVLAEYRVDDAKVIPGGFGPAVTREEFLRRVNEKRRRERHVPSRRDVRVDDGSR